ncbi:hypothetical protein MBLNU13_g07517t2 [Cladosporium sp. NU13]
MKDHILAKTGRTKCCHTENEPATGGTQLNIFPGDHQLENWKIKYNSKDILIGATGVYHPFTNEKEDFVMQGLTGCTAIIVVSKHGVWAGHLWEGTKTVGGGSSFQEVISDTRSDVRSKEEFEAIAVNIQDKAIPLTGRNAVKPDSRPGFQSLKDVANDEDLGNPFKDNSDVEVFILTKANSAKGKTNEPLYKTQLNLLIKKFKSATLFPEKKRRDTLIESV